MLELALALATQEPKGFDPTEARTAGAQFARCAVVYNDASLLFKANGLPENAEIFHNLSNGAAVTSRYFLGIWLDELPFSSAVDAAYESEEQKQQTIIDATLESDGNTGWDREADKCSTMMPIQERVVSDLLSQAYKQKSE